MLHKLFDGHPNLVVYPTDLCFLYAYFPCHINTEKARIERLRHVLKKSLMAFDNFELYENKLLRVDKFLDYFFQYLSAKALENKSLLLIEYSNAWYEYFNLMKDSPFVVKETSQAIFSRELIESIPEIKIISLIRDPRDNYAAIKAGIESYYSNFGESELESLASVINRSRMDLLAADYSRNVFPNQFLAIKFEDLINDIEKSLDVISSFCEINNAVSMRTPTILGKSYMGNSYEGERFNGVSNKNVSRWRERISDQEAKIIEFWASDAMRIWHYELAFTQADSARAYSDFYNWYNCRYFYYDSFS